MRVLVCGGRSFDDYNGLERCLDDLHAERPFSLVIHGAALGADRLADQWAHFRNIPVHRFPAEWKLHGRSAGPIRNAQMLREGKPDLVIAFPGRKGTADMIRQAEAAGVPQLVLAKIPKLDE